MKKNFLLLIAGCASMLMSANVASAQDETVVVVEEQTTISGVDCKDIYTSSWRDNWFLQIGAGAQTQIVDRGFTSNDKYHITTIYNVGVGHWFSPYLGIRFSGYYGTMHWDFVDFNHAKFANLNADLMWDMFSSISGYDANRVFSIVPFVGIGGTFVWDYKGFNPEVPDGDGHFKSNEWMLPVSAGLQFRFRLCRYVDFFVEGRANFYGDNYDRINRGKPVDINLSAIGGFTFNFGGRNFTTYNTCDNLAAIAALNDQVNDMRAELAATSAALAAAQAQLPCPEVAVAESETVVTAPLLSTVRFRINSSKISDEEMVNVYNVAQYMKANPETSITIAGYADKDTGTSAYNMKLSERRAQAVYDTLVNTYGIDPQRLNMVAAGSDVQPYDTNDWNRIVIFAQ